MTPDDLRPIFFVLIVASGLMLAVGLAVSNFGCQLRLVKCCQKDN